MTKSTTYCDVCGAEKKAANHWYAIAYSQARTFFVGAPVTKGFVDWATIDVCGDACRLKAESRILEGKDPRGKEGV